MSRARTVVPVVTLLLSVGACLAGVPSSAAAAAPTVTGVSPASGPATGGNVVTVRGTGLSSVTRVSFGSATSTSIKHYTSSIIFVTAPKHGASRVDVRVTSSAGTSTATSSDFYYYASAAPKLSWTPSRAIVASGRPNENLADISCAAQDHCVVMGTHGHAYTWNGHYISYTTADSSAQAAKTVYDSISCATTTFCVAVGYYDPYPSTGSEVGKALVLNGTTWSGPVDLPDVDASDVSCSSAQRCVALTDEDHAVVYDAGSWSGPEQIGPGGYIYTAVSCAGDTFCLTVTRNGLYSTYNGHTWSDPGFLDDADDGSGLYAVDCPLTTQCTALTGEMRAVTRRGITWGGSPRGVAESGEGGNVSCPTTRFCVATTDHSVASPNATIAFDGAAIAPTPAPITQQAPALGIGCGSDQQCVVVSAGGQISIGHRTG